PPEARRPRAQTHSDSATVFAGPNITAPTASPINSARGCGTSTVGGKADIQPVPDWTATRNCHTPPIFKAEFSKTSTRDCRSFAPWSCRCTSSVTPRRRETDGLSAPPLRNFEHRYQYVGDWSRMYERGGM